MFVEFVIVPIVGCLLLLTAAWRALSALASALHWSSWAPTAVIAVVIAGVAGTLLGLGRLHSLREEIRMRREHREQVAMEQRYPGCHVLRLSNGNWFLTDRSTGREYQPTEEAHHSFTLGRTRDGSSRWLQQISEDLRASGKSRSSR
ncbi:hypothetical protein B0G80_9027 [Paraburkholderia sp. BL6669N2]|uniref:hypothetical protein n=1 Tax=unclassified Paraburkholderia TaxID=2615204 RepID=UPI000E26E3C3|nr:MULTISPECIES: hypothetical protein [unclassified Paraburkholderia]REE07173.1 hypothetical protein B0G71_7654 [Paraburkholderia sp. BL27I4N3]REG45432.1 hypothetical protein B0G80_9027 [Paraburkholderia sp. BL6669N2]